MKKRFSAAVCALLLCAGLFAFPFTADAAGQPCFMALNNRLLDLEDQYMPIAVGGLYYVPYTVFDNTLTDIDLGVYLIMNQSENTLSLYSKQDFLTFYLSKGNSGDREGQLYESRAITRNGLIYLPARFVCDFFGLIYSSQSTQYGPLVRIRTVDNTLSDAEFVAQADRLMADRLTRWEQTQAAEDSPTPSPTPTSSQSDRSGTNVYLGIRHSDGAGLDALLESLADSEVHATFFFPADELAGCDEAIRLVLCAGHQVGLLVSGTTAGEVIDSAAQGNRLLAGIALLETKIVLAADTGQDAVLDELESNGLLCWRDAVDGTPDGRTAYRQASSVLSAADARQYEVWITLDDSEAGAAVASRVIQGLRSAQYHITPAVETAF